MWFVAYSDVYHCGREIISDFPVDLDALVHKHGAELKVANHKLMESLQVNSLRRSITYQKTGLVEYDEFYPKRSKIQINDIDKILSTYFGLSSDEEDFVLNYDVKFRLGRENEDAAEIAG
jgi:hypothetical protein